MTYKKTSAEENSVVTDHCSHLPLTFSVNVKDSQDKNLYWLPKCHKQHKKNDVVPTQANVLQLKFLNY